MSYLQTPNQEDLIKFVDKCNLEFPNDDPELWDSCWSGGKYMLSLHNLQEEDAYQDKINLSNLDIVKNKLILWDDGIYHINIEGNETHYFTL